MWKAKPPVFAFADHDYADVNIYIANEQEEWFFRVSLDRVENTFYDSDPQFAGSPSESFEDADTDPPPEVLALFHQSRPAALAILEQYRRFPARLDVLGEDWENDWSLLAPCLIQPSAVSVAFHV